MNDQPLLDGKIVRSADPLNLEMPFEKLESFLTPVELFYVRMHYAIPQVDRNKWRLRVEGEVEKPFELNYDEFTRLASKQVLATLECAGNSRSSLEPKVPGVQWGLGAVGNASWTGVPLSTLLDRAGVKPAAREVILEGADEDKVTEPLGPHGKVRFARSVPLAKAREDVLLACKINDVDLPAEHGFPVRAIVPGWYAVASVKWLERILVTGEPFTGFYQTLDYSYWRRVGDEYELEALREMPVKSEIARPVDGQTVPADSDVRVHGAAWTGGGEVVARVELSVDGGATWNETRLGEARPNAWRLWEYDWRTPATPGKRTLVARATDSKGRTQPARHDPDRLTYMINQLLPINVEVR
jgi:DMSO/TMAO reductase YedYZ molybdopterin-dependent catalytic subunit